MPPVSVDATTRPGSARMRAWPASCDAGTAAAAVLMYSRGRWQRAWGKRGGVLEARVMKMMKELGRPEGGRRGRNRALGVVGSKGVWHGKARSKVVGWLR
eukprot:5655299-Pleurochrysis_carterae.AAC.1